MPTVVRSAFSQTVNDGPLQQALKKWQQIYNNLQSLFDRYMETKRKRNR